MQLPLDEGIDTVLFVSHCIAEPAMLKIKHEIVLINTYC